MCGSITTLTTDNSNQLVIGMSSGRIYLIDLTLLDESFNDPQIYTYDTLVYSDNASSVMSVYYDQSTNTIIPLFTTMTRAICISLSTLKVVCTLETDTQLSSNAPTITTIRCEKNTHQPSNKPQLIILTGNSIGKIHAYTIDLSILTTDENTVVSPVFTVNAHYTSVRFVRFDGYKIVSAGVEKDVKVFDVVSGRLLKSLAVKNMRRSSVQVCFLWLM